MPPKKTTTKKPYKKSKKPTYKSSLVKDVLMLKRLINVEKKRLIIAPEIAGVLGQTFNDSSCHYINDITPRMLQGTGEGERIGNSYKLTSSYFKINFRNNGTQTARVKVKWYVVKVKGVFQSMDEIISGLFMPNEWILRYNTGVKIFDTNSMRNTEFMSSYQILRSGTTYVAPDTVAGQNQQKQITIGMKYKDYHIRYNNDLAPSPNDGQLVFIAMADRGNAGTVNSGLVGVIDSQTGSGFYVDSTYQHYIVDN